MVNDSGLNPGKVGIKIGHESSNKDWNTDQCTEMIQNSLSKDQEGIATPK